MYIVKCKPSVVTPSAVAAAESSERAAYNGVRLSRPFVPQENICDKVTQQSSIAINVF